ncbi:hypothetical protein H3V53_05475 [Paraburkholderia bengalensis]|uniref:Uncharacterized protein n=1 Tax=Paraburkholderia bengalensis TaxID=2747562 RepID=A0ABU8IM53_9BURK
MTACRRDEWSDLLLRMMKTSLSVAHELRLAPEAVLDCAAKHLRLRDFTSFASAMQGAARAHACCRRRDGVLAVEVAYIKILAANVNSDRNVLADIPTMCAPDLQNHVEAPARAYEKVAMAIEALKTDVQRDFSLHKGALDNQAVNGASKFAKSLAAIVPVDDEADAFDRALAAVLHVRFAAQRQRIEVSGNVAQQQLSGDAHPSAMPTMAPAGWMQHIDEAVHHHRDPMPW